MRGSVTVLQFLAQAHERGERCALVAIARVTGSSSRRVGTLLGVTEAGAWRGSLSGGCVEAAVVGEAQRVIASGRAEVLALGAGSPLIDIRLPCGGGLDLLIVPGPSAPAMAQALDSLDRRAPVTLTAGLDGQVAVAPADPCDGTVFDGETLAIRLDPVLRVVAIGQGEEVIALARQALAYGAGVIALTPDEGALPALSAMGAEAHRLLTPRPTPLLRGDPETAIVFLFHDHDWEHALLRQALDLPALLVGAMGSRKTHALRLEALARAGVPQAQRERIVGPIGLIAMTRDPDTLALSVLAEIAAAYQAHCERSSRSVDPRVAGRDERGVSAALAEVRAARHGRRTIL